MIKLREGKKYILSRIRVENSKTNMDKKFKYVLITSLIACGLLYYVEQVIKVNYLAKTFVKLILFTIIPFWKNSLLLF